MNADLLARLDQAQTDAERTWLITESLLQTLSPELQSAVWAAAVPHWFDADILAALLPNLSDQAASLYEQLQQLSFVEVFPGRGHNIHERTRKALLNQLWQNDPNRFRQLASYAAEYFSQESTEPQIEAIYHQVIAAPEAGDDQFWDLAQTWHNDFRLVELEALLDTLREHIAAERLEPLLIAKELYWRGKARSRAYQNSEALANYEQAIALFRDVGDRLGEANTLKAIGDVLQFLDRRDEALANYEQAIALFRDVGDRLGEANTLTAIGDVLQFLDRRDEALANYEQAIALFRDVGDRLGEANTLTAIGDVLQFLKRTEEALANYEQAIALFRDVGSRLGEANTLTAIGDVLQFLKRTEEALANYEQAIALFRDVGSRLGEANTLKAIGDVLQFLDRRDEALANYEQAIALFRDVGSRLGEANTLTAIGDVLQFLDRRDEALANYKQAIALFRDVGDRLGEANTLLGLGDLKENDQEALDLYNQAQQLYQRIGDQNGQARNLGWFIAKAQANLGQVDEAIAALQAAADFYDRIGLDIYRDSALQRIEDLRS